MAVQFPNFLNASTQAPDYSGVGDVFENFYKGYHMPNDALIKKIQAQYAPENAKNDALIKRIQAEFARPNAQEGLTSSRLGNRKSQLDIDKLAMELSEQQELEKLLRQAFSQGGAAPVAPQQAAPPMPQMPVGGAMPGSPPVSMPPAVPFNNKASQALSQAVQAGVQNAQAPGATPLNQPPKQNMQAPPMIPNAAPNAPGAMSPLNSGNENPIAPPAPVAPTESNEIVIAKGSPQLSGIDLMYDNNPLSRAFLEKKGFKKTQEVKFDNKTGRTSIITKYPSGKVTMTATPGVPPSGDGIPLTNKMVSTHQRVISSVDNALPLLKRLKDMESHSNIYAENYGGNLTATHNQKQYQRLVNAVKENLIGAFALNPTEAGLQTAIDQLTIGGWESEKDYKKAIQALIDDLNDKKSYSEKEVKRSSKISPVDTSASSSDTGDDSTYSSNEWEPA